MLTSVRNFARPLAIAALLVPLIGNPSPAAPGSTAEAAGSAADVVRSVPYQVRLTLTCAASFHCSGEFPKVAAKRRLNVTRMSCHMKGPTSATYAYGYVMGAGNLQTAPYQFLPGETNASGFLLLNQAIDLHVAAGQQYSVFLSLSSGIAELGICTATGTLDVLQ